MLQARAVNNRKTPNYSANVIYVTESHLRQHDMKYAPEGTERTRGLVPLPYCTINNNPERRGTEVILRRLILNVSQRSFQHISENAPSCPRCEKYESHGNFQYQINQVRASPFLSPPPHPSMRRTLLLLVKGEGMRNLMWVVAPYTS